MKKIKLLLVALTFSLVGFISCTDAHLIENQVDAKSSILFGTTLNEIKKGSGIGNRLVYPFSRIIQKGIGEAC